MYYNGLKLLSLRMKSPFVSAILYGLCVLVFATIHSAIAEAQVAPLKARSFRDRVVDKVSLNDNTH